MKSRSKKDKTIIKQYYSDYISNYKHLFIVYVILSSLSKAVSMLLPFLNSLIIDGIIAQKFNRILILLAFMGIVYALQALLSYLETYINVNLTSKIEKDIKIKLFGKILYLRLSSFNEKSKGDYLSMMEGDVDVISSFFCTSIVAVLTHLITILVSGIFIFHYSVSLSIIGLLSLPINIIIYGIFGKKIKNIQTKVRHLNDKNISIMNEALSGIKEIKGLAIEEKVFQKYLTSADKISRGSIDEGMVSARGGLVQMIVGGGMLILQTIIACLFMVKGILTIGAYVAFTSYLSQFTEALTSLSALNISVQKALVSMNRLNNFINEETIEKENTLLAHNKKEASLPTHLKSNETLNIHNLTFAYSNTEQVINDLSLTVHENELVAIVGKSGSGKSTLFNLIMNFYDSYDGEIYLNGIDINETSLHELRKSITYVQQDPFLFNDTIRNNLLLAKEEATEQELIDACKQAFLMDFIDQLPDKLDTPIGEQGALLSGGQRQRLAIARGILRNSKFFLLDEVTSDLDGEAEVFLVRMLNDLSKSHTILMNAHRLKTVINVPRILVTDKGKIIAEGNHNFLIENNDIYKKLFAGDTIL